MGRFWKFGVDAPVCSLFAYRFPQPFHPFPLDPVSVEVCSSVQSLSCVQLFATAWTSTPGSSVRGILQARILEWVAISFSRESS